MDYISKKNVLSILLTAKPIGFGVDSICFLMPNNEVLKLFKNNDRTRTLINQTVNGVTFEQKLIKIGLISNDVFVGPEKLLYINGQLSGYYMRYINIPTLEKLGTNTRLSHLFDGYGKMLEALKEISEKKFELFDIKCNSVYLDKFYKISDLDRCKFVSDVDVDTLYQRNARVFLNTIIWKMFKIRDNEYPSFEDKGAYKKIFNETSATSLDSVQELQKYIMKKCQFANPTITDIRTNIKVKGYYNSYLNDR